MCSTSQFFSGFIIEDANKYFVHFERIATANGWNDERKIITLSLYLKNLVKTLNEKIENRQVLNINNTIILYSILNWVI